MYKNLFLLAIMLISLLVLLPLVGILYLSSLDNRKTDKIKIISLFVSIITLSVSLIIYVLFDNSNVDYQFIQEISDIQGLNIYIGIDGISLYFILLTTFITPIVILSNWNSISDNLKTYMIIILLLEMLLIFVFLVLNIFLFYIFFESTLIPLFLLIGIYGSYNKVRASFYLFYILY